jgi:chromosomal replication initiator protein
MAIPGIKNKRQLPSTLQFKESKSVISAVERYFNLSYAEMIQKTRVESVRWPRQVLMYLLSKNTNMNKTSIGMMFKKDHSTVILTIRKVQDYIDTEDRVRSQIKDIVENI